VSFQVLAALQQLHAAQDIPIATPAEFFGGLVFYAQMLLRTEPISLKALSHAALIPAQ
jgi:hypothetical protein